MICQYYRSLIEKQADTNTPAESPRLTAHLKQCSACREYREQLTALEARLKSQPACELSEDRIQHLQTAVMERLSDESLSQAALCGFTQPKPAARFHVIRSIAAVLALAAVAGLGFHILNPTTAYETLPPAADIPVQVSTAMTFPDQLMQSEIQKLTNDTKRAIGFLKQCTPTSPVDTETLMTGETAPSKTDD